MRVLLTYGAKAGTTGAHLHRALERNVETIAFGAGHARGTPPAYADGDQLVWVESGERTLPPVEALDRVPSVGWIIDTHLETSLAPAWRLHLATAFDHSVFAQRPAAELVASRSPRTGGVSWLPLAAPKELCGEGDDLHRREYDVAFVGAAPAGSSRAALLSELSKEFRLAPTHGFVQPERMMDHYRSARVVINPPRKNDLNMRQFEGAGARAVVVTRAVPGLSEAFPAGSYVTVDGDGPQAWIQSVREALRAETSQAAADSAFETVLARHTYDHRADAILSLLRAARHVTDVRARAAALGHAHARYGSLEALRSQGDIRGARTLLELRSLTLFWRVRDRGVELANRMGRLHG